MPTKNRFGCCNQPHSNSPLWDGPGFSRRQFFRISGTALSGYYFSRVTRPLEVKAAANVATQGTAKYCLFVFLNGGPSHIDTFDLKEGSWTPSNFAPTSYGDIRFPQGLMPKLAENLDKLAIVRSVQSWAAVHQLAQVWAQIARNPTAAMGKIAPNIGAVVALEKEKKGSKLPGFMALNSNNPVGPGYLQSRYAPFSVTTNPNGLAGSTHPDGQMRFNTRIQLLNSLDGALRSESPIGREGDDMGGFYEQARGLMYNQEVDAVFRFTTDERTKYGTTAFGDACIVARNILKANVGTSFIQIQLGGWDNHSNIYGANAGVYLRCLQLDNGLSQLLRDLADTPGPTAGKTLLDETLIVVMGEFGRTVGNLNNQGGRDHFLQQFVVFAGGGTRGGRVIGETNATGGYTLDPGWERNRPVRAEDIAATIYSALGIDWTTVRYDDPFKRGFEYVPFAASNDAYGPVNAIFA